MRSFAISGQFGYAFNMKRFSAVLLGMLAVFMLAGCQFAKPINWNSRVGSYSFDQAVIELGPPVSQAKLSDGRLVAKWVTRYAGGGSVIVSGGFYAYPSGVGIVQTSPNYYERQLILTFSTNNVLASWTKK